MASPVAPCGEGPENSWINKGALQKEVLNQCSKVSGTTVKGVLDCFHFSIGFDRKI